MNETYFAIINLKLGDREIINTNDTMCSIDHVRIAEGSSESCVIELYDETGVAVDDLIASLEDNTIEYQYGYSGGIMSPWYKGTVAAYNTSFEGGGCRCTLECTTTEKVDDAASNTETKTYRGRISDIVYEIAADEGWTVGVIQATKRDVIVEVTRKKGQSACSFITDRLLPKAVSEEKGEAGYNFFLYASDYKEKKDDEKESIGEMITGAFKDINQMLKKSDSDSDELSEKVQTLYNGSVNDFVEEEGKNIKIFFGVGLDASKIVKKENKLAASTKKDKNEDDEPINPYEYQYVVGMPNEKVISFTPEYEDLLMSLVGADTVEGDSIDPETGEEISVVVKNVKSKPNNELTQKSRSVGATYNDKGEVELVKPDRPLEGPKKGSMQWISSQVKDAVVFVKEEQEKEKEKEEQEINYEGSYISLDGYSFTRVESNVRRVAGSSYDYETLKAVAKNVNKVAATLQYRATLVLVGQPGIVPNTTISILVLTREGLRHHSSGTYLISSVEDNVEGGSYTTTLLLMKNIKSIDEIKGSGEGGNDEQTGDGCQYGPEELKEKFAKYIGVPYKWGGYDWKTGFDCSGFTWHFMKNEMNSDALGSSRTTTYGQIKCGVSVLDQWDTSFANMKPLDVFFPHSGHVMYYTGEGDVMIHAPKTGDVIKYQKWSDYKGTKKPYEIRRVL